MSLQKIEEYGVIGAGGAGFPTHVKLDSKPDTVIMNAAECEPLLHKDMEIILHYADEVLAGFRKIIEITGAKQGLIGIKEKHHREIELLNSNNNITSILLVLRFEYQLRLHEPFPRY